MPEPGKRGLLISAGWAQAVIIVFCFGFIVLGLLAYRTYTGQPPIPGKVADSAGRVLFTRSDIVAGQEAFLRNGLMEYGSIFGHGAYLALASNPALRFLDFTNKSLGFNGRFRTAKNFSLPYGVAAS